MKTKEKFMSIRQYATACKISVTAVEFRIKNGKLETFTIPEYSGRLIDLNKYPIVKKKKAGRRKYESVV